MKILIISDIHANFAAIEAIGESFDELWVLGDIVNYGPDPAAALEFVRKNATVVVRGNHDNSVGYDTDAQCSPRFREMAEATRRISVAALSAEQRRFLAELPLNLRREADRTTFMLCHATPSNPLYEYCAPDSPRWEQEASASDADVILVGHTHLPFVRRFGQKVVANPGSLGQSKAGKPEARYALWNGSEIELRAVPYDVEKTVAKVEAMAVSPEIRRDLVAVLRTGTVPK